MSEYIYVIGMDGNPQMPTKRKRHVEKLLQTGRARVFRQVPYTIQLTYKNQPVLQPVTIAEDPGRSNIGMAVVSLSGELLSTAVVQTRNKEIVKLMEKRKQHRRASRNGERKARQRLAKKCHTMIKTGFLMRKLPMYGKDKRVRCNVIKNTEAKFCNRKREDGWLTPSAEHLVRTHINLIHKMQKFLPITDVAIEINRFAFLSLEDPSISGVDFQNGPLKGYDDLNAAIEDLQDGHCLMCNSPIEHRHHIVPRNMQGSNTIGNIAGLCCKCHERVHKDSAFEDSLKKKKDGLNKRYAAVSTLIRRSRLSANDWNRNSGRSMFITVLDEILPWSEDSLDIIRQKKNSYMRSMPGVSQFLLYSRSQKKHHRLIMSMRSCNFAGRIAAGSKLRPLVHTIMKERKLPRTAKKRKDKEKIPFRSGENDRLRDMEKSRPEK